MSPWIIVKLLRLLSDCRLSKRQFSEIYPSIGVVFLSPTTMRHDTQDRGQNAEILA